MIRPLYVATLAAALVAAAPAQAQRASLADRVAALEQQAANNQGNVDLLNQVNALKSEVAALRAQLEELQHQNEQLTQANRSQYLDLAGRLNRLEGGAASAVAPSSPIPPATPAKDTGKTLKVLRLPVGHHQMAETPDDTLFAIRDFLKT